MTESDWMHYDPSQKIPPDLTPRLVVHGGPVKGPVPGNVDPNDLIPSGEQGKYERFEFPGGAFWQWQDAP